VALTTIFSLGVEVFHMCLKFHHELLQLQYLSHLTSVEVCAALSKEQAYFNWFLLGIRYRVHLEKCGHNQVFHEIHKA